MPRTPGQYIVNTYGVSLRSHESDEQITREYVFSDRPTAIEATVLFQDILDAAEVDNEVYVNFRPIPIKVTR